MEEWLIHNFIIALSVGVFICTPLMFLIEYLIKRKNGQYWLDQSRAETKRLFDSEKTE